MALDVSEYFQAKFEEKIKNQAPAWESPQLDPETQLLSARHRVAEAEKDLAEKRAWYVQQQEELSEQWKELDTRREGLREQLIQFDKYLKETDIKRERADKRASDQHGLLQQKEDDLNKLKMQKTILRLVLQKLRERADRLKVYQDFMEAMVEKSEDYDEPKDVMNRFETLIEARNKLQQRYKAMLEETQKKRSELANLTEQGNIEVMQLNNRVCRLKDEAEEYREDCHFWESDVDHVITTASQGSVQLAQTTMAIRNMYIQACRYTGHQPLIPATDTEDQLKVVTDSIRNMEEVISSVRTEIASTGYNAPQPGTAVMPKSKSNMTIQQGPLKYYETPEALQAMVLKGGKKNNLKKGQPQNKPPEEEKKK